MSKDFRKLIFNVNILEIKIHDKISVIPPIIDIPSIYLFRKTDDRVITIGLDTSKNMVLETLNYKVKESYITKAEMIRKPIEIRTTSAKEVSDHG